ncbi:MAG: hypothetical protein KKD05_10350, partial [Candidatus Omnitrophica bacterium]|nr:hypothetical protein [Candidatus Omnitrophota bacterium]
SGFVCGLGAGDTAAMSGRHFLSPRLEINTRGFKQGFPRQILEYDAKTLVCPIEFPLHLRPFELLCDLCKVIADEESVLIQFKILTEDGEVLLDLPDLLSDVALQMEDNNLTVYNNNILPLLERVNETRHGIYRIKENYRIALRFKPRLWHAGFVVPVKLKEFLRKFFANNIQRKDGSSLDVGFPRETETRYSLDADDYIELMAILGYNDFPVRRNVRGKKIRDNGMLSLNGKLKISWMMQMWMNGHTPDKETETVASRKGFRPQASMLFDSAI